MGALVCDNTFGTDVEELFLNIKAKTLFYCASVQFVFYEKHIYYTTKNKLICCISPITGFTCDQSYMHSKRKKKKTEGQQNTFKYIFYTLSCVQCFFLFFFNGKECFSENILIF